MLLLLFNKLGVTFYYTVWMFFLAEGKQESGEPVLFSVVLWYFWYLESHQNQSLLFKRDLRKKSHTSNSNNTIHPNNHHTS